MHNNTPVCIRECSFILPGSSPRSCPLCMPRAAPQDHGSTLLNFSDICIGNRFSPHDLLHQNRMGYDIASVLHRFFYRFKRFMRRKHQTIRIINQRISGNPCLWLICLGKPPSMIRSFPLHLTGDSPFLPPPEYDR